MQNLTQISIWAMQSNDWWLLTWLLQENETHSCHLWASWGWENPRKDGIPIIYLRFSGLNCSKIVCVSQHNEVFRKSWHSRECDWFLAAKEGGRCFWVVKGRVCRGQAKYSRPPWRMPWSCPVKYQKLQRDSAMDHVRAVFLKSIAYLLCCPIATLSVIATLCLPAFWEQVLLQVRVCVGKLWKWNCMLLVSASLFLCYCT